MAGKVTVNDYVCKGCGLCASVCPKKILERDRTKLNNRGYNSMRCIDESQCIACAMCAIMCPDSAITIEKE